MVSVEEVVDSLNDKLRLSDQAVMTVRWPQFYELAEMQRFREPRGEQIRKLAQEKYGLVIAYGHSIVIVAHDRNFAPMPT